MPVAVVKRGKLTLALACLTDRAFIKLHCIGHEMGRSIGRATTSVANTASVRVGVIRPQGMQAQ